MWLRNQRLLDKFIRPHRNLHKLLDLLSEIDIKVEALGFPF